MKKIIGMLIAVLVVTGLFAGCGGEVDEQQLAETNNKERVDAFFEKYKREDISFLQSNPEEFFDDYTGMQYAIGDNAKDIVSDWDMEIQTIIDQEYEHYTKDILLFGLPAKAETTYRDKMSDGTPITPTINIYLEIETGDAKKDFQLGEVFLDAMIKTYGDPTELYLDHLQKESASEAELRRLFTAGQPSDFSVYWTGKSAILSYYYYEGYSGVTSELNIY